jgi:hypothetical protein
MRITGTDCAGSGSGELGEFEEFDETDELNGDGELSLAASGVE